MHLICRNRVEDFARWHAVFAAHRAAHEDAGLRLEGLWRDADDPAEVVFLFRVEDRARAEGFMGTPEAAAAGRESGVLDGEYRFLEGEPACR